MSSIFSNEHKINLCYVYDLLSISCLHVAFPPDGTYLLVCDNVNYIRKICLQTEKVSVFARITGEGLRSLTFTPDGKYILLCIKGISRIDKICVKSKQVSNFAGHQRRDNVDFIVTQKEQATFNGPTSVIFSTDGTYILVCDMWHHCIRRICINSGQVTTFAGRVDIKGSRNGAKEQALFNYPRGLVISVDETYILVCDSWNHCIRKIDLKSKVVSIFAGIPGIKGFRNGIKNQAIFKFPKSVTIAPDGTFVLIVDGHNHCIRKICMDSEQVSTFAGIPKEIGLRNGPKEQSLFEYPISLTFSKDGKFLVICDQNKISYMKIKN